MPKLRLNFIILIFCLAGLVTGCGAIFFGEPPPRSYTVSLGDVDADGDPDAVVGNGPGNTDYSGEPNTVWLNDGSGHFSDTGQRLIDRDSNNWDVTHAVALGDLDEDGDIDAFFGNAIPSPDTVWFNDGQGNFHLQGKYAQMKPFNQFGYSLSTAVTLGDLDGDGDLDVYIGNCCRNQWGISSNDKIEAQGLADSFNMVWFNNGEGFFTDSGQRLGNWATGAVALGDLDGDGDLDAFEANRGSASEIEFSDPRDMVWFNDGSGNFTDSHQRLSPSDGYTVALGDFDGDNDLDAFIGNAHAGMADEVWFNNGTGFFTDSQQRLENENTRIAVLDDLDHDGDLDAFVGYERFGKVWINDGEGNLSDSEQHFAWNSAFTANLADINNDGHKDIFAIRYNGEQRIWYNDGGGHFNQSGSWPIAWYLTIAGIALLGFLFGGWRIIQRQKHPE